METFAFGAGGAATENSRIPSRCSGGSCLHWPGGRSIGVVPPKIARATIGNCRHGFGNRKVLRRPARVASSGPFYGRCVATSPKTHCTVRVATKHVAMLKPSNGKTVESSTATWPHSGHTSMSRWVWPIAIAIVVGFGLTVGIAKLAHRAGAVEVRVVTVIKQASVQAPEPTAPSPNGVDYPPVPSSASNPKAPSFVATAAAHAPRPLKSIAPRPSQLEANTAETSKTSQDPNERSTATPSVGSRKILDSGTISRTIAGYSGVVQRTCWQPALANRSSNAPPTARVMANVDVGPDGKVHDVHVSPDPQGYRGLSSCIQSKIRTWSFPRGAESTEINVPFVFTAK